MSIYYVQKTPERFHKPTLDELFFVDDANVRGNLMIDRTSTTTRKVDHVPEKFSGRVDLYGLLYSLKEFNETYGYLKDYPREQLYIHFTMPKKKGGVRPIDEPVPDLKKAQRELWDILDPNKIMYHTSAYAYIPKRSTKMAAEKHAKNESRFYASYDMKNFFPSVTLDFVMRQFSMIYPFCDLMKWDEGRDELAKALDLAFLKGGLPQGSPLSPALTNIMMIPIDYELTKRLRRWHSANYIYTRYADDIQISNKYDFDYKKVERLLNRVLKIFDAPFSLNKEKTKYKNRAGSNWILGVMVNKDNNITIGYRAKKLFEAKLTHYCLDRMNDHPWDIKRMNSLMGYISHYRSIERPFVDNTLSEYSSKFHMNIEKCLRKDIDDYYKSR